MKKDIPGITIGIPVRNEEHTIAQTVYSITNNYQGPPLEILVCVGASTDNTLGVVKSLEDKDKRVKLLFEPEPGKPAAWNTIVQKANYDDLVFADGDVLFGQGAITTLINYMHDKNYAAVTARQHALIPKTGSKIEDSWLSFLNYPFNPFILSGPYLCGRLYSMDRLQVLNAMEQKGYSKMPQIINEDTWLSLILETRDKDSKILERNWGYCKDAVVFYHETTISDKKKHNKRLTKGHVQLEKEHPLLHYKASNPGEPSTLKQRLSDPNYLDSTWQQILTTAAAPIQGAILGAMWHNAMKKSYADYEKSNNTVWEIIESTKGAFSIDAVAQAATIAVKD